MQTFATALAMREKSMKKVPLLCFSAFDKPLYAKMIEYKSKKVIIRPSHSEDDII